MSRFARRCLATVAVLSWLGAAVPSALADRPFTPRFSTDVTGNITFAANTLMVCPASAAGCTAARNTRPVGSGSNAALDNNGYDMQYVNAAWDGSRAGGRMSRIRVVRLVVGDLVAARDGDRSVRRALLGG